MRRCSESFVYQRRYCHGPDVLLSGLDLIGDALCEASLLAATGASSGAKHCRLGSCSAWAAAETTVGLAATAEAESPPIARYIIQQGQFDSMRWPAEGV